MLYKYLYSRLTFWIFLMQAVVGRQWWIANFGSSEIGTGELGPPPWQMSMLSTWPLWCWALMCLEKLAISYVWCLITLQVVFLSLSQSLCLNLLVWTKDSYCVRLRYGIWPLSLIWSGTPCGLEAPYGPTWYWLNYLGIRQKQKKYIRGRNSIIE